MKARAPDGKFLYGWLLVALFLEYARPASFAPFLNIPFFYSAFPILLFVFSLFSDGLRDTKEAFSDRQAKWIFLMVGVLLLSVLVFRTYAIGVFVTVLGYAMVFFVIARVCTTWERVRGVIKMLVFAHLFLLAMNPQVLLDPSTRQYIKGATFLGDGNDFGLSICLLLPGLLWVAQTSPSKLGKLVSYASILILLYAVVATQSRGATLGIGAVLAFLWWTSKHRAIGAVAIVIAVIGMLALAPSAYTSRMSTISNPTDGSAQGRIDAWMAGIGMGAKNPLVGIGAGSFGPRWGKTAHSTYVLAFGELGLPGFVCVLAIVVGNLRSTISLRKRILAANPPPAESPPQRTALRPKRPAKDEPPAVERPADKTIHALLMSAAMMIGFGVAGAFLSATYYPHLYVLAGLMLSARALASRSTGVPVDVAKPRMGFKAAA